MAIIRITKGNLYKSKGCNCIPSLPKDLVVSKEKSKEVTRLLLDMKKDGKR